MSRRILYIQYTNPASYPPLEHSSRILADYGWNVLFLGIKETGKEKLEFPLHERISVKLLPSCKPGWRQKLHYLRFICSACWVIVRFRYQWVYASEILSTPAAFFLKTLFRRKIIYHEHDFPIYSTQSLLIRVCMLIRKWIAKNADYIIVPNRERGKQFALENGISTGNIHCIWNCPAQTEAAVKSDIPRDECWIIYHGSVVPDRLPLTILHALSLLPNHVLLRVIGYETLGSLGYIKEMKNLARDLGILSRIQFLGALPRRKVFEWCRKSNVGLALIPIKNNDINMTHMTGASNKPFDNLACGIPLLVSDLPDWRQMFVDPGYALACNPEDPESIASALRWYVEHPDEMRKMGALGQKKIQEEWNYESQFEYFRKKILCHEILED